MPDLGHFGLWSIQPGESPRRVTGDDDRQAEDDDRDDQQERRKCQQPPADVSRHRALTAQPDTEVMPVRSGGLQMSVCACTTPCTRVFE